MNNFQNSLKNDVTIVKSMPKHGSYVVSSTKQLLTIKAYNDWNMETVFSYCQSFKEQASTLTHDNWSSLIDLSDWGLGPPEMLNELQKLNLWSEAHKQNYVAIITKCSLQQQFLIKSHQVFKETQAKFFDNEADALSWLSDKIQAN